MIRGIIKFLVIFILTVVIGGIKVYVTIYCIREGIIPADYIKSAWIIIVLLAGIGLIGAFFEVIIGNWSYGLGLLCGIILVASVTYHIVETRNLGFPKEITTTVKEHSTNSKDMVLNLFD